MEEEPRRTAFVDLDMRLCVADHAPMRLAQGCQREAVGGRTSRDPYRRAIAPEQRAEGRIEYGPPAEVILGVARNLGADLLVIGQRASGLNLLLPNSVTDHLIGSEELPILIAKSLK